ncbi:MAG: hypothetical protein ABI378_03300 [Chitinophagaceae bacterium]
MLSYRQVSQPVFLLLFVVAAALFQIQSKPAKTTTTAVSTMCTLRHYQRQAPPFTSIAQRHNSLFGEQKSGPKKDTQPVVVYLFAPDDFQASKPIFLSKVAQPTPLQDVYRYLYFKEINPPPPKAC